MSYVRKLKARLAVLKEIQDDPAALAAEGLSQLAAYEEKRAAADDLDVLDAVDELGQPWVSEEVVRLMRERDAWRAQARKAERQLRQGRSYRGGVVPFGWAVAEDGALIPNEDEQDALVVIRYEWARGASSRKIEKILAGYGVKLSHVTINKLVKGIERPAAPAPAD